MGITAANPPASKAQVLRDIVDPNRGVADPTDEVVVNPPQTGQIFTLTSGVDNIIGTAGDDTIIGYMNVSNSALSTITSVDRINGGVGTDTLNVTFENANNNDFDFPEAEISNVEIFNLRNVSSKKLIINASHFPGVTQIWADRATSKMKIEDLVSGAIAGMRGNGMVENGNLTFGYVTSSADAMFAIDDGTRKGNVTISSTPAKVVISSTGAANTIGTVF